MEDRTHTQKAGTSTENQISKKTIGSIISIAIALTAAIIVGSCQAQKEMMQLDPKITSQPPTATAAPVEQPPSTSQKPTAGPTVEPVSWKRINSLQFIPRDLVTAIVVDPSDPDIWYAGTRNSGVYKSNDGGISWISIQAGLGMANIDSLIIDPSDPKTLYLGLISGGVYKTTNGGEKWNDNNFGINFDEVGYGTSPELDVSLLVMSYQDSQHLYYTDGFSVYESTNGSLRWQKIADGFTGRITQLSLDPLDDQVLYLLTVENHVQAVIWKSADGGETWEQVFVSPYPPDRADLAVDQVDGKTLYFFTAAEYGFRLHISQDSGETWNRVYLDSDAASIIPSPDTADTAYLLGFEIMKTTDGGNSWFTISDEVPSVEVGGLAVVPGEADRILLGTSGLYELDWSNQQWVEKSAGLGAEYLALYLDPSDQETLFMIGDVYSGLYVSDDGGANWDLRSSYNSFGGIIQWSLALTEDGRQFKVINRQIFRSEDQGDSWFKVENVEVKGEEIFVNTYQSDHFILHRWPETDLVSFDGGISWQVIETEELGPLSRLVFVDGEPDKVYIVADYPWRSEDGGLTWDRCGDGHGAVPFTGQPMAVVDPQDSDHLLVATGNGILATEDGCRSWQQRSQGMTPGKINTLSGDPNQPEIIYAGTTQGAFVSYDFGGYWQPINEGLPDGLIVYSMAVDRDSEVFAVTPLGVFQLEAK